MTLSGNLGSYIKPKKNQGRRPKRNLERRSGRRHVKAGYPVEPYNMSYEQFQEYLSGDRIVCLLCGRSFKGLGVHVPSIHGMTTMDYRYRYGMPLRAGLNNAETKERISQNVLNNDWLDTFKEFHKDPEQKKARLTAPRRKSAYRLTIAMRNVKKHTPSEVLEPNGTFYPDEVWGNFLALMRNGKTPSEIRKMQGMPKTTCYYAFRKSNVDFDNAVKDIIKNASFEYLARMEMLHLSDRFMSEVKSLREQKLSDHTIADKLGITAMTVNNFRKKNAVL